MNAANTLRREPLHAVRWARLTGIGLAVAALVACGPQPPAGIAQIDGDYAVVSRLRPHSLQRVRIEVAISFHCPACKRFQPSLDTLAAKYGERLSIEQTAVTPRSGSGRPERLFLLAKRAGLGPVARDALYRARFDLKQDIEQDAVLGGIARQIGLPSKLLAQLDSAALKREQASIDARTRVFAAYTPSILVEDQLLVDSDAAQIARVINGLLPSR